MRDFVNMHAVNPWLKIPATPLHKHIGSKQKPARCAMSALSGTPYRNNADLSNSDVEFDDLCRL